eukprot:jgi/Mesvir1/13403/Mv16490-RA.1
MGNSFSSSALTQADIEEVHNSCGGKFSHQEIEALYKRFRELDRNDSGFISPDEFLSVPEIAVNPLSHRLIRVFEMVNFKDFVLLLGAFSRAASREEKLEFIFKILDVDGDGMLSREDVLHTLKAMAGTFTPPEKLEAVCDLALDEVGVAPGDGISLDLFMQVMADNDVKMQIDIPITN